MSLASWCFGCASYLCSGILLFGTPAFSASLDLAPAWRPHLSPLSAPSTHEDLCADSKRRRGREAGAPRSQIGVRRPGHTRRVGSCFFWLLATLLTPIQCELLCRAREVVPAMRLA